MAITKNKMNKAVFLDRDGSTNHPTAQREDGICLPSLCFQPTQKVAENIK
jgi:hypothetical protein